MSLVTTVQYIQYQIIPIVVRDASVNNLLSVIM